MDHATCLANQFEPRIERPTRARSGSAQAPGHAFFGMASLLFIATPTLTLLCWNSMAAMPGMPMPGGWKMWMTWMRTPGHTWPAAAASFLGMWIVMMIAMMLPSLISMLQRYRQAIRGGAPQLADRTCRRRLLPLPNASHQPVSVSREQLARLPLPMVCF